MYELRGDACEALLSRNSIGRLGCYSPADHQVYIVPVSYGYHDGSIFFGSTNGDKIEFLRAHPKGVCFEVDDIDNALNWSSVIVHGDFEELHGRERRTERPAALQRAQSGPMHWLFDPDVPDKARKAMIIGAIRIKNMSGRRERWTWNRPTPLPLSLQPVS